MRRLYRVFPWIKGARARQRGHPLHVPAAAQGGGRLDNPDQYRVVYGSDSPAGACAEALGGYITWSEELLHPDATTVRAIATMILTDDRVLDLDDPRALLERELRPSRVVTRDREVTQAWSARIFDEGTWSGVSWWSYWDPRWASFGIWRSDVLRVTRVEPLTMQTRALREAAEVLNRVLP
ncbi:MAG: RES family NAD+ phosphorylase [Actinomycetota bacterium]